MFEIIFDLCRKDMTHSYTDIFAVNLSTCWIRVLGDCLRSYFAEEAKVVSGIKMLNT